MHGISWNLIPQICDFDRLEVVVQSVVWVLEVAYYYFCVLCFVYSISAFIKQDKGPQILNLSRDRGGETHCSWCFYYHLTHIKCFLVLYVNIWCVFSVGGRSIKHLSFICSENNKSLASDKARKRRRTGGASGKNGSRCDVERVPPPSHWQRLNGWDWRRNYDSYYCEGPAHWY